MLDDRLNCELKIMNVLFFGTVRLIFKFLLNVACFMLLARVVISTSIVNDGFLFSSFDLTSYGLFVR